MSATRGTSARRSLTGLSSIPFMIGDTGGGSCASITVLGVSFLDIDHPNIACSRLNISENNSPLLHDRVYASYRHFHNISETDVFGFSNDLNIERLTVGAEKTFADGLFSMEVRVPVNRELASTFSIVLDQNDPTRNTLPLSDRDGEFGNVSVLAKVALLERETFFVSGGCGVLIPTAESVNILGDVDSVFEAVRPGVLFADVDLLFDVQVENATVNISPFLAWAWVPRERLFHQGFLQIDVPANPSAAIVNVNGEVDPFLPGPVPLPTIPVAVTNEGALHQQTLMRLNLGLGYTFYDNPCACYLRRMTGLLELHYTTTLQDAKLYRIPLFDLNLGPTVIPVDEVVGNRFNRVDLLNLTVGHVAEIGKTTITNGFVIPLRGGEGKPFDVEYNLQVQRRF